MKINNMEKMTIREVRKLFIQFLKENNALGKYKKNVIKRNEQQLTFVNYINPLSLMNHHDPGAFIIGAFIWNGTDEGDSYWNKLDNLWRKKLINEN